jgi:hypothetical protein
MAKWHSFVLRFQNCYNFWQFIKMVHFITKLSIISFSIMTLSSIKGLSVTHSINDTQQKQHSAIMLRVVMLSVVMLSVVLLSVVITALFHYAECGFAKCHILFIVMLNAIMLSVIILSIVMLNVVMLGVVMVS